MNSADKPLFSEELRRRQQLASRLLQAAVEKNSFANAYLLTGRQEADKWLLTTQLAAYFNCLSRPEGKYFSCLTNNRNEEDYCQNCRWIAKDEHPQALLTLRGPSAGKRIPVEKARNLSHELSKTSKYSRLICIPNAEQDIFHAESANALLKSIEEPGFRCHFFLFATSAEAVLATIVSRCQQIPCSGSFSSGLWAKTDTLADHDEDSPDKLESLRSKMTDKTRLYLTSAAYGSVLQSANTAQELSRWLLELTEDGFTSADLLDMLVSCDLSLLRQSAINDPKTSLYLQRLVELVERSKQELSHYVKDHNVLESFSYQLTDLRSSYLGDPGIAKDLSKA